MALLPRRRSLGQFVRLVREFRSALAVASEEMKQAKLRVGERKVRIEFDRALQRLVNAQGVGQHPVDALSIGLGRFLGGGQGQAPGIIRQTHHRLLDVPVQCKG